MTKASYLDVFRANVDCGEVGDTSIAINTCCSRLFHNVGCWFEDCAPECAVPCLDCWSQPFRYSMDELLGSVAKVTNIDPKTLTERALKLSEECGEVAEAVLSSQKASSCGYKDKTTEDVVKECCDVLVLSLSIIHQATGGSIELDTISTHVFNCLTKWESKCKGDDCSE